MTKEQTYSKIREIRNEKLYPCEECKEHPLSSIIYREHRINDNYVCKDCDKTAELIRHKKLRCDNKYVCITCKGKGYIVPFEDAMTDKNAEVCFECKCGLETNIDYIIKNEKKIQNDNPVTLQDILRILPEYSEINFLGEVYVMDIENNLVDKEVCILDLTKSIQNQDEEVLEALLELIK